MKIKICLTPDEIRNQGFRRAMDLKWLLEDLLWILAISDDSCKELIDEIQKKKNETLR